MFISAAVDAHEGQDVATFDIPGAYLHIETDKDVIIFLEGALSEIMGKVALKIYRKYIIMIIRGQQLLYVKIQKAFHGLLRSALLFYRKLAKDLEATFPMISAVETSQDRKSVVW